MIESHRDLLVWKMSMDLAQKIYGLTKFLPRNENWGLVSQLRRAAVSVPSNIAEGYGRNATGEYKHHLSIGLGSLLELETQLVLSQRLEYLKQEDSKEVLNIIEQLNKMLVTLIKRIKAI